MGELAVRKKINNTTLACVVKSSPLVRGRANAAAATGAAMHVHGLYSRRNDESRRDDIGRRDNMSRCDAITKHDNTIKCDGTARRGRLALWFFDHM